MYFLPTTPYNDIMLKIVFFIFAMIVLYSFLEGELGRAVIIVIIFILGVFLTNQIDVFINPQPPTPIQSSGENSQYDPSDNGEPEPGDTNPYPESNVPHSIYLVKDLQPFHTEPRMYSQAEVNDVYGNRHLHALIGIGDPSQGASYYLYKLNQEYGSMSFTVFADCNADASKEYYGFIYIFGDDDLLYKNESINCLSNPEEVTVDLNGVDVLKIEMYGEGNKYAGFYGIGACMGDIVLRSAN